MMKVGPKHKIGTLWDEKGFSDILSISISHQQGSINSINFSYCGDVYSSKTYGELDGLKFNTVKFDYPSEYLTSISGKYDNGRLVSIVFGTNCGKYGPFGTTGDTSDLSYDEFEYEVEKSCFGGFHGSVHDGYVYAIGVYVKPYSKTFQDFPLYGPSSRELLEVPQERTNKPMFEIS